jgi:hypothetical protein
VEKVTETVKVKGLGLLQDCLKGGAQWNLESQELHVSLSPVADDLRLAIMNPSRRLKAEMV